MRELLIKQLNTYAMIHNELRENNINDIMYYKKIQECIRELKQLDNVVTLSDHRDNKEKYKLIA